jgi:hypothetical protein
MTPVERIRTEIPLGRAWKILNLPGEPVLNRDLHSPFRKDKKPSFRIYQAQGHERWHDHGSGMGGDAIDLWAAARGITVSEAIDDICAYLDGTRPISDYRYKAPKENAPESTETGFRPPPDMRIPSESECRALALLRPGILPGAFDMAGRLGTLRVATIYGVICWVLTDATGICAEARRMDGQPFPNGNKSFCLPGSKKYWPVGLKTKRAEFDVLKNIVLVEGLPDYYAALSLAIDSEVNFRPATMLGAGLSIGPAARECFRGAHVLIIPHNDKKGEGEAAAQRWSDEIKAFGASRIFIQRLPIVCNDVADYLQQTPDAPSDALLQSFQNGLNKRTTTRGKGNRP